MDTSATVFERDDTARPQTFVTIRTFGARLLRVGVAVGFAMTLATPTHAHAGETAGAALASQGNAVTHWNAIALDVFAPTEGTNPMAQSRTFAILHASIHDAVNAIEPRFKPGCVPRSGVAVRRG
jgi:hypothetical protein